MVRKNAPKVEDSKPLLTDRKKDEAGGKVETVRRAKSAPLKNTGSKTTEKRKELAQTLCSHLHRRAHSL